MDAADLFNQRCVFSELLYGSASHDGLIWIPGFPWHRHILSP